MKEKIVTLWDCLTAADSSYALIVSGIRKPGGECLRPEPKLLDTTTSEGIVQCTYIDIVEGEGEKFFKQSQGDSTLRQLIDYSVSTSHSVTNDHQPEGEDPSGHHSQRKSHFQPLTFMLVA